MGTEEATNDTPKAATDDPQFGPTVFAQILELWVRPELERRGLPTAVLPSQALVIFKPTNPPVQVLIGDECGWVATVRATRAIAKAEPITRQDFSAVEAVRPATVDANAGWIGFVTIAPDIMVAFDFRRNRQRARQMLQRAQEFAASARWSFTSGAYGPALDSAFAAAELAVTAQLSMFEEKPPRRHSARQASWASWAKLGNAPAAHARVLSDLWRVRPAARYAEAPVDVNHERLDELLTVVEEMLAHASSAVGELQETPIS